MKLTSFTEIGHEKAQSVIDSITSSYAAEGQAHANPMLPQNQPGQGFLPPPFAFPGGKKQDPMIIRHQEYLHMNRYPSSAFPGDARCASWTIPPRTAS